MKHKLRSFIAGLLTTSLLPIDLTNAFAQTPSPQAHHSSKSKTKTKNKPKTRTLASSEEELAAEVETAPSENKKHSRHSAEWKLLPKQKWELFNLGRKPDTVITALDKYTKTRLNYRDGFEPQAIAASEPLPILGQVIGSRTDSQYFFVNDIVYIKSNGLLQVGDSYGLTDTPELLKSSKSDRTGYSYLNLGKVKILAVRDELFLGVLTSVKSFIPRGTQLIAAPPKILYSLPLDGPSPVQGTLIFDHRFSTFTSAQHKEVFIDRGSADGLAPGMIFRVYQHYDPSNEKKITSSEFIVDAELQLTQVTEAFSSALILSSYTTIIEHSTTVLMTDVSDLIKHDKHETKGKELDSKNAKASLDPLEELDRLDSTPSLGVNEKKKLHQLEKWQGNPVGTLPTPAAAIDATPPPETANPTTETSASSTQPPSDTQPPSVTNDASQELPAATSEILPPPLPEGVPQPPPPGTEPTSESATPHAATGSSSEPELPAPPLPVP